VYLKKGLRIEGILIELRPGKFLKVELPNGDTLSIDDIDVKRYYLPRLKTKASRAYEFREHGLYQVTTAGLIFNTVGASGGGIGGVELSTAFGYQHDRLLGGGVGVGADFYHAQSAEMIFPLFGEIRGYFLATPSTPYYVIRAGYGFAFANREAGIQDARGGFMFNPAIGWRLGDRKGLKMTIDVGLKFQEATFMFRSGAERSTAELTYRRLNIRMGFLF